MACADPEGGGQGVRTPLKNHKNIGFLSNTGPDPLKKTQRYQARFQYWAIIGPPAKRKFINLPQPPPPQKKNVRVGTPLAKHSGSAYD